MSGVRSRHGPWEALKADTWRQYGTFSSSWVTRRRS